LAEQGALEVTGPYLLLEDLTDILPIKSLSVIFEYLESQMHRILDGLEPGRGKALILLRLSNEALRRLSRSENAVLCGRIQIFLSSVFPLSERSGVNLKGEFHAENVTEYEREESGVALTQQQLQHQEGTKMDIDKPATSVLESPSKGNLCL
jgi:THO complex subunit 1